jgi:hypothetical protein
VPVSSKALQNIAHQADDEQGRQLGKGRQTSAMDGQRSVVADLGRRSAAGHSICRVIFGEQNWNYGMAPLEIGQGRPYY